MRLLRAQRIDVLHANTSVVLGLHRPARRAGVRHVVHVREIYPPAPVVWPLHRRAILRADRVVCVSEAVRSALGGGTCVVHDGLAVDPRAGAAAGRAAGARAPAGRVRRRRRSGGSPAGRARRCSPARWPSPRMPRAARSGVVAGDAWPGQERHEDALRASPTSSASAAGCGSSGSARTSTPSTARPTSSSSPRRAPTRCRTRRSRRPPPAAASSPPATAACRRSSATARPAASSRPATTPSSRACSASSPPTTPLRARLGAAAAADVRERFSAARLTAAAAALYALVRGTRRSSSDGGARFRLAADDQG